NLREDRILHRIGVLELIHQRDGETLAQTFSQLFPSLAPQCFVQSREHVIKRLNAPICLPPAQFLARPFTKFRLQRDDETFRQFCELDRKSTRLNSSHLVISYAVFCLKKKNNATYLKTFV